MSNQNNPPFFLSLRFRYGVGLLIFMTVAGFFLWEEHKVHIMENSVLVFILGACVGMHLFMHGGHRHGGTAHKGENPTTREDGSST